MAFFKRLKLKFSCKSQVPQPLPLTAEEVSSCLTTENRAVIQELYALVLSLYNSESDRTKSLDAKAAALFGFVGAMISAIFVVLGFLSDPKDTVLSSILSGVPLYILIVVLALLSLSLLSLFRAVVIKKSWKAPGGRDLFEAVHMYDGHVDHDEENPNKSAHDYKRHLIEHFWKLYQVSFNQNESKAKALFSGQFSVFVGLILLVAVQINAVLAFRANMSTKNANTSPASATAPEATKPNTISSTRPAPLPVSSKGTETRESTRPEPLKSSSSGSPVRNSIGGRPQPLTPSSKGTLVTDGADSKKKK